MIRWFSFWSSTFLEIGLSGNPEHKSDPRTSLLITHITQGVVLVGLTYTICQVFWTEDDDGVFLKQEVKKFYKKDPRKKVQWKKQTSSRVPEIE